ncbi:MAG: hypothetical protein AAFV43_00790 [Planctomycetota bacterium]
MQATRTLIGALVGLALGIALLIVFNVNLRLDAWWTFIPVGLVIGLSMRMLASTGNASYLRGGVAALLTGVAATLGPMVSAAIVQSKGPDKVATNVKVAPISEEVADDVDLDAMAKMPERKAIAVGPASSVGAIGARPSKGANPLDYVFLGASVLVAYELGKGAVGKSTGEEEAADESGEGEEAAAEPTEEEPANA